MPQNLRITPSDGYIHVRAKGAFSFSDFENGKQSIVEAAINQRCLRVLVDSTDAETALSVTDQHRSAEHAVKNWLPGLRIAIVFKKCVLEDPDPIHFVEVARNRGAAIKDFGTIEEAVDWLVPPAS
jgi:hypothetical protein